MRPEGLGSKIFLDGGNPDETGDILDIIGFLDGQTTNPTLIARNPWIKKRLEAGGHFNKRELLDFYRDTVRLISSLIPGGSVSIEVYADLSSSAEEMLAQAEEMNSWIPNAHIKFPTSHEGLKAANRAVHDGFRVNMTLCFSQEQAAAVYSATRGAKKGDVFISPFVGRLDDIGENGMDLVANIMEMYRAGDGHVEVLTASVRNMDHFLYALQLGSHIITAPFSVLKEWKYLDLRQPKRDYRYDAKGLKEIPYKKIDLSKRWEDYDISHDLTQKGIVRFSSDWNALIG
ncbi:MAG: transaldolase family protein [Syntrophales bacterium]|nr:transaldolase family protein [Syntrophales bacterium]